MLMPTQAVPTATPGGGMVLEFDVLGPLGTGQHSDLGQGDRYFYSYIINIALLYYGIFYN